MAMSNPAADLRAAFDTIGFVPVILRIRSHADNEGLSLFPSSPRPSRRVSDQVMVHITVVAKLVRDVERNLVVEENRSRGESGGTPRNRRMRAESGEHVGFAAAHRDGS